ncbi:class I SAM-dependent methyltransferase [Streptomyces sp. NPDC052225]|uniref:class I SAM-dependent methyltransferase n=1 Tax=Streptomyces sp. NPDC052225 TaxID=3154949 RepID=UPI003413E51E
MTDQAARAGQHEHEHRHGERDGQSVDAMFEPAGWDERYAGQGRFWSGKPNPQLVTAATDLTPGTALDVGCGEGGDVIWLAGQGWRVTGADFSAEGLARAARHAEDAGVADRVDWWQVDARTFDAGNRAYDLVTSHYLHAPDGGMVEVTRRLAGAVAPGGLLLVVGHAPSHEFSQLSESHRKAMFLAEELLPGLPADFEPVTVEQRTRTLHRDTGPVEAEDSLLLARRSR